MSLPSQDADVNIILNGQDNASIIVEDSTKRINRAFVNMRNEQRAVGRQFELNNRTFVSYSRAISTVGNIAQRGIGVWQAYTLGQIRLGDALRDHKDIQRELNDAIAEGDIEAQTKLNEDLADSEERIKQIQQDNIIGYITSAFVIAGMASSITTKALPAILKLRNGMRGLNLELDKTRSITGTPKSSTGLPAERTPIGTSSKTGTTSKGGGLRIGRVGGIGASGAIGLATLILDEILSSENPLETAKQIALDPFNFSGKRDNKITFQVTIGNETRTEVIDLNNPYAVS